MMKVLGRSTSGNVQKVVFLLEELALPYRREDYGRQFGNTATPEYLALNPHGKVPTLVDGDVAVWESNTILRYVANSAGAKGAALYPSEPAARSRVERWMDWLLAALNPPYMGLFREAKKPEAERAASWGVDAKDMAQLLSVLDGAIGAGPWITGTSLSLADVALAPIVHRCLDFPIDLPALAALRSWRARVTERPAFNKAVA
ncbi:MAG: glutathione S-transferase family protein [Alphaproteobacteria bacterium]